MIRRVSDAHIRDLTLTILSRGCDVTNYLILKELPTTTSQLRRRIGLSKMPFYRRINRLAQVGLLQHERGSGTLLKTEITERFIALIEVINREVAQRVKSGHRERR